jgi:hypothetical protein
LNLLDLVWDPACGVIKNKNSTAGEDILLVAGGVFYNNKTESDHLYQWSSDNSSWERLDDLPTLISSRHAFVNFDDYNAMLLETKGQHMLYWDSVSNSFKMHSSKLVHSRVLPTGDKTFCQFLIYIKSLFCPGKLSCYSYSKYISKIMWDL